MMKRERIEEALKIAFPEAIAAMLTGSVARGTATAQSDIDVVLLDNAPIDGYRYTNFLYDGYPFEVTIFSTATYAAAIESESYKRNKAYFEMLSEGKVLYGPDGAFDALVGYAALYSHASAPVAASGFCAALRRVYSATNKAGKPTTTLDEQHTILAMTARNIARIAMFKLEENQGPEYFIVQDMAKRGPLAERQLLECYLKSLHNNDFSQFLSLVKAYLAPLSPYYLSYSNGNWHRGLLNTRLCLKDSSTEGINESLSALWQQSQEAPMASLLNCAYWHLEHEQSSPMLILHFKAFEGSKQFFEKEGTYLQKKGVTPVQFPVVPICMSEETLLALEYALAALAGLHFTTDDAWETMKVNLALMITGGLCKGVDSALRNEICQRFLYRALPLYQGNGLEVLEGFINDYQQIATGFYTENRDYFKELFDTDEASQVSTILGKVPFANDIKEIPHQLLAVLDFCFAALMLSAEEQYLVSYAILQGLSPQ